MDHDDLQYTPNYFFSGNDGEYYVSGNLVGDYSLSMMFGRFSNWFLSEINERPIDQSNFVIAPNPCTDYFYIISDVEPPFNLGIYNLTGEKVLSQEVYNNISSVDVSGLSKGLYLVKVNNGVKKIIIN